MNATQSLERWLPVSGYQDFYEVSDLGRVRSVDRIIPNVGRGFAPAFRRGKIRKLQAAEYGHLQLKLSRYGLQEKCWVHRLVLEAFVGPRPDGMVCCHRDGNPTNNHAENLYWGTPSQNNFDQVRHGTHTHAKKTWCVNGHEFNGANTIHRSNGGRDCRACQRDRNRELMRAKRARLREVS